VWLNRFDVQLRDAAGPVEGAARTGRDGAEKTGVADEYRVVDGLRDLPAALGGEPRLAGVAEGAGDGRGGERRLVQQSQ
jgi:hypothetical protein